MNYSNSMEGIFMRSVDVARVTDAVREMCIEVNHKLSPDMAGKFPEAREREESPLGRQILGQLIENMEIARTEMIPICQDTGMAVVFLEVGQDVHFEGGNIDDAVIINVKGTTCIIIPICKIEFPIVFSA